MYHPWNTKSHRIQQNSLLHGLLDTGHHVLGVFGQSSDIQHDNYTEIVARNGFTDSMDMITKSMLDGGKTGLFGWMSLWPKISQIMSETIKDVKNDNDKILAHIKDNKLDISVMTFTVHFGWLGD